MKLNIYQVDAFAENAFEGNPAAVIPLESWLEDGLMQLIAEENNLAETAFFVGNGENYEIRWFSPATEVDLCGHATLASAHVIFNHLGNTAKSLNFKSNGGDLMVRKEGDLLTLNFPTAKFRSAKLPDGVIEGLGVLPKELYQNGLYMMVLNSEAELRAINPNFDALKKSEARAFIVTARGEEVDFVSRFFAPKLGINEDPVTGSAHTYLIPYWSQKLNKKEMIARQLSARGGRVICKDLGDRVEMSGKAITYLEGQISI